MSETTPEQPARDGEDLAEIRAEIDELKAVPEEELVSPTPAGLLAAEPEPEPTDPIGSADDDDAEPTTEP